MQFNQHLTGQWTVYPPYLAKAGLPTEAAAGAAPVPRPRWA